MPAVHRLLPCPEPFDPRLTFGHLGGAPNGRVDTDEWWRASNTPEGAATLRVGVDRRAATLVVEAWGDGAQWVVERAPMLTGAIDDPATFTPRHPRVAALRHRLPGLRLVGLGCVHDAAMATIIEQRVTSVEARRTWRAFVYRYGAAAPGPGDLRLAPSPRTVLALRDWEWRALGIEGRRAAAMRVVAGAVGRLDEAAAGGSDSLAGRLTTLRGCGPWTTAHLRHCVAADADAVPVGDWHLPRLVAFALTGEVKADDARLLELLEPFRPHRARVWRLVLAAGRRPPRRAPRAPIVGLLRAEQSQWRRQASRPQSSRRLNGYR